MSRKLVAAVVAAGLLVGSGASTAASFIVLGGPGAKLDQAVQKAGGVVTRRISAVDAVVADSSAAEFKTKLGAMAGVELVLPNIRIDWYGGESRDSKFVRIDYNNPPNSGDNDTFFNRQWGHDAVNAVEAWNAGYRGAGARVAVLDGGFNTNHPDISQNFDPSCSTDFTGEGFDYAPNEDDATGVFSHGMHVAGTIAAGDNGFGTIGVAPEAKLCLIKVLFNYGSGSFEDVVEGIVYAADQGVDVINMSLGGSIFKSGVPGEYTAREAAGFKNFVNRAVTYAYQKGVLVIVSAGNEGSNGDKDGNLIHLPSDTSHAVSISATAPIGWAKAPTTTFLDNPASYTNFGRSVISLAAPGGDVAYPGNENCTLGGTTRQCYIFDLVFSVGGIGGGPGVPVGAYYYWSAGTSMAAPHAAGVAALAISRHGKMKPAQLRTLLEKTADDLGQPGNDPFYGAGRVNAENAVK
jgi:subtilisin family serine protease